VLRDDRPGALHKQHDDENDSDEHADEEPSHEHRMRGVQATNDGSATRGACSFLACEHHAVSDEVFVSVDIEASGASPSVGSMISLGACLVDDPSVGIYLELRPDRGLAWDESAAQVHGLARERLEREGLEPAEAMQRLAAWLAEVCGDRQPVFVGFNAAFDWMFVADYFARHVGSNPFGVSALDLKSYFMGRERVTKWADTRRVRIDDRLGLDADHTHHALEDARGQARLARILFGTDKAPNSERGAGAA
jgi:ribonuclease T